MEILHQGDILKIEKIKHPVLVVSKDFLIRVVKSLDVQLLEILLRVRFIYGWLQKKMKVIYNVKNLHC